MAKRPEATPKLAQCTHLHRPCSRGPCSRGALGLLTWPRSGRIPVCPFVKGPQSRPWQQLAIATAASPVDGW